MKFANMLHKLWCFPIVQYCATISKGVLETQLLMRTYQQIWTNLDMSRIKHVPKYDMKIPFFCILCISILTSKKSTRTVTKIFTVVMSDF